MAEPSQSSVMHFSRAEIVSILFGLILAMFLASLDQTIVATSLSTMARDLNGWTLMSWVVSAYLVASTVTTPIYGKLSDLYGRRPVLSVAITLFLGASVLCALSQNMPQLIGARVLQGIGGGGLRSVALAAVADIIPPRERGRYQGYFSSVMAISNVLGPVLGGFFSEYLTWHWIFWINLPFGSLALLLCWRNLRRLPKPRRKPIIDWLGAALILASTTPILIGLGQAEAAAGWGRSEVLLPIAVGIAFLAMLIYRESEAPDPIIPLRLFANRIFAVACFMSLSMSMVMIAMIILVPLDFELGVRDGAERGRDPSDPDDRRNGFGLVYRRTSGQPHRALPHFSDPRGWCDDDPLRRDCRAGARPLVAARYGFDRTARLLLRLSAPLGDGAGAE